MIYILLNAGPILAAALASLAFGVLYTRLAALPERGLLFLGVAFVAQAWFAAILAGALILAPPRGDAWTMAIGSAVVIWIGFVVPATVVTLGARRVGAAAIGLDCLHWLVAMLIQAVVLKSIGLVPPPV